MQRLGYSVVQEEVLRSISPLRQQTVASVGRAKSVCLMAKTPECPSEPAMSLLLFGSFSAYPTPPRTSLICKCTWLYRSCQNLPVCKQQTPLIPQSRRSNLLALYGLKTCTLSSMWYGHLGSLSNQSGDDILLKSICIAFRGGHTPALRPRKVPKPRDGCFQCPYASTVKKKRWKKYGENKTAKFPCGSNLTAKTAKSPESTPIPAPVQISKASAFLM